MIPPEPTSEFAPSGFDDEFASPADYARLYRLRGIQIVPAFMPDEPPKDAQGKRNWKRPLLASWTEFQEALIPDDKFAEWYGHDGQFVARPNLGAITGRASDNLLVIDLDTYKNLGAKEWWENLIRDENNRIEPETVEQRTGGGGSQKLFRAPLGWPIPNKNIHSMGIDIKGQGGFVMLPPSKHETGKTYEWLEGQSPDDIPIMMAPDWLLEAVEKLVAEHGGSAGTSRQSNGQGPHVDYSAFGKQTDGRESRMSTLIWGAICDWYRERYVMGRDEMPTEAESLAREQEKYAIYASLIGPKLDEDGIPANRGLEAFHAKWRTDLRKWHGKVRDEALKRPPPKPDVSRETPTPGSTPAGQTFELLDIDQIESLPDPVWLVNELVIDHSLGFIYGPPSSLKTFIALDLALSFTTGQTSWWGRPIQRHGAVIYICNEGVGSLKFRIRAWKLHHNEPVTAATTPFFLIRQPLNFMDQADVITLMATVEEGVRRAGVPIAAIFVDTLSKVLPGAEENQQKDMSLFMQACGLLRDRFSCVVFGIHHTNASGGFRGSTVMPGAGDFMIETRREPGALEGSIFAKKVKDADDGWEQKFKVTKVIINPITGKTSLAIDPEGVDPRSKQVRDELPSDTVREQILTEIDKAWLKGKPWTHSENTPRGVVSFMTTKWKISRKVAKALLTLWTAHGIIEHGIRDPKNHVSGYKRLIKTDQNGGESNA